MSFPESQVKNTFVELVSEPDKRFQSFFNFYCNVSIVPSVRVESYLRMGKELIRMANIYFAENDYLHAFVLYSRFLVLFLEKLKTHENYANCDKNELSLMNKQIKSIAFPRAEKLKKYIKELFQAEKLEYEKKIELNKQLIVPNNDLKPTEADLDSLKQKYNIDNENELSRLRDNELNSLLNKKESIIASEFDTPNQVPHFDRNLKPKSNDINNYNLRTIVIPSDLTKKFLDVSLANTNRNIETCGFLAGQLKQNSFVINTLIIPKQQGTSDTCSTVQEHELFDTIDSLNLITLGWIHTHPSQTAFLSSIDLHTQFGFQIMVPEAIAIVCSPKYNENRTFILTPNFGIKEISECSREGFHHHPNNPAVFEECDHVKEDTALKVNLIDLRFRV